MHFHSLDFSGIDFRVPKLDVRAGALKHLLKHVRQTWQSATVLFTLTPCVHALGLNAETGKCYNNDVNRRHARRMRKSKIALVQQ
jgi:hypothetical protein